MFIPGIINLVVEIDRCWRDREGYSRRVWAVMCAVIIPLFPLRVIMNSILTAVLTLRGEVSEWTIEGTKEYKLIEIIGERQCCIKTCVMFSDMFYYQYFIHFVFTGESLPQAVLR